VVAVIGLKWLVGALAAGGMLAFILALPTPAAGQSLTNGVPAPKVGSLSDCQERARGGTWFTIECAPGFATARDRLTVVLRSPIPAGADWSSLLDMRDSTWLYDAGATGDPQVVVNFHPASTGLEADVYDSTSDLRPSYKLLPSFPNLLDHARPVVRVMAPDGWWIKDGRVNFNLDLIVDGRVMAAFGAERYLADLATTGTPAFNIQVHDTQGTGRPDVEVIQATPPDSDADAFIRTETLVNTAGDEPALSNCWLWPFLSFNTPDKVDTGGEDVEGIGQWPCSVVKDYNDSPPPIWVNSGNGAVQCITEFVASRGAANNWFAYSIDRLGKSPSQVADWESPFAFYDFANRHDGWPDTVVRVVNWNARDPYADCETCLLDGPMQLVRYAWDQTHSHSWSFKVDLVGRHAIDGPVQVPGLRFQSIPYGSLPGWVTSQKWDTTAFVAVERPNYWTSEGIYEWDADTNVWTDYVSGAGSDVPASNYSTISAGFRGEYTLAPQQRPQLYFSPIDHRLHLLNAQGGVWNNDDQREVQYETFGTPYVVRWTLRNIADGYSGDSAENAAMPTAWNLTATQENKATLTFASGQLLLQNAAGVFIKAVDVPPATFTTLPPADHDQWQSLGQQLNQHAAAFAGYDLLAMFQQFDAPAAELQGATIQDFRLVDGGFRFALTVPATVRTGADWIRGRQAGEYLVRYDSTSGFSAQPMTPAVLRLDPVRIDDVAPIALKPLNLSVAVHNDGADDAPAEVVTFNASNGQQRVEVGSVLVRALAGESSDARVTWTPPTPGAWHITAGTRLAMQPAEMTANIAPAEGTGLGNLAAAQGFSRNAEYAIAATLAIAFATAGCLTLFGWRNVERYVQSGRGDP